MIFIPYLLNQYSAQCLGEMPIDLECKLKQLIRPTNESFGVNKLFLFWEYSYFCDHVYPLASVRYLTS